MSTLKMDLFKGEALFKRSKSLLGILLLLLIFTESCKKEDTPKQEFTLSFQVKENTQCVCTVSAYEEGYLTPTWSSGPLNGNQGPKGIEGTFKEGTTFQYLCSQSGNNTKDSVRLIARRSHDTNIVYLDRLFVFKRQHDDPQNGSFVLK